MQPDDANEEARQTLQQQGDANELDDETVGDTETSPQGVGAGDADGTGAMGGETDTDLGGGSQAGGTNEDGNGGQEDGTDPDEAARVA